MWSGCQLQVHEKTIETITPNFWELIAPLNNYNVFFSLSSKKFVMSCSLTAAWVCVIVRQRPTHHFHCVDWRAADDTHRYLTLCRATPAERCKVNNGHIGLDNCWTCSFTPHRVHTHAETHAHTPFKYLLHISLCTCMCRVGCVCSLSMFVPVWISDTHVVKLTQWAYTSQGQVNNKQTKQLILYLWKTTLNPPSNLAPTNTYRWDINGLLCPLWPFNYSDLCTEQACRNCISISAGLLNVPVEGIVIQHADRIALPSFCVL